MNQNAAPAAHHVRFTLSQRYLHGILLTTFLGLALTGLPLRFSSAIWAERIAAIVGGFAAVLFLHKFFAIVLTAAFLYHAGNLLWRGFILGEKGIFWGPDSLVPRLKDVQDLWGHLKWFLWLGPKPRFDRFAYWEKVDYWAVFWGMAIIGFSGYTMWFSRFFARFLPGSWLNVALLLHGEEALLAVWFIFAIHFFNTHLRPGSFPMDLVIFTGSEAEEEFKKKHPEEYHRLLMEGRLQSSRTGAPPLWLKNISRVVGVAVILTGFVLLWLTLSTYLRE